MRDLRDVAKHIAIAIGRQAQRDGVAPQTSDAELRERVAATQWTPGVNNLGTFGRWTFAEFRDVYEIEKEFANLVEEAIATDGKR